MDDPEEYGDKRDTRFKPGNQAAKNRGPNHVSSKVKESIVKFLENNIDAIQQSFDELKPKEKLEFISGILQYAAPKLSNTSVEQTTDGKMEILVKYEKRGNSSGTP